MASFFSGKDIGVSVFSVNSTFTGSFDAAFSGWTIGYAGAIDQLTPTDAQPPMLSGISPASGTTLTPALLATGQLGGLLILTGTATEPGSPLPQSGVQSVTCNGVSAHSTPAPVARRRLSPAECRSARQDR